MTQLLEKEDYVNLGANDLVKKGAEVIKKEEEEKEIILKKVYIPLTVK